MDYQDNYTKVDSMCFAGQSPKLGWLHRNWRFLAVVRMYGYPQLLCLHVFASRIQLVACAISALSSYHMGNTLNSCSPWHFVVLTCLHASNG